MVRCLCGANSGSKVCVQKLFNPLTATRSRDYLLRTARDTHEKTANPGTSAWFVVTCVAIECLFLFIKTFIVIELWLSSMQCFC